MEASTARTPVSEASTVSLEAVTTSRSQFPLLLSPFRIGELELRNRLVFQPHFTALGHRNGMPSDAHVAYHEERARGGVGLIVFESMAVHPTGKMSRRFINAWDAAVVPMCRTLTDAVHAHGAKIVGQLTHAGHTSLEMPPHILWAPTQMPEPSSHFSTKAMDRSDIDAVVRGFATSAKIASDAGFDGVEIKIAHDGLLRSFASPFFNHRTDEYGGSFENRMRISIEVLEAIRAATDSRFPIGVRLCLHEFTPFGYELEYGLRMAAELERTGLVAYFNSDAGSFSSYWMEIPPAAVAAGTFRKLNTALKETSSLPVIAFGRISPPALAEEMLEKGEADLIGMARQLIADPDTANKLQAERPDLVRLCIACNDACIYQVGQEKAIRCVHNPDAGRERELNERDIKPADRGRRVVIVGGGPAGLKAAETAARRGHRVTLLEREAELGGQIRLAARQPHHQIISEVTRYLEAAVNELGVDVRLGVDVSPETLLDLAPDILIVATGSEPNLPANSTRDDDTGGLAWGYGRHILPDIPGLDLPFVISSDQVLSKAVVPSGQVLVIDANGHWEAAGTAEFLCENGCTVQMISGSPLIGSDLESGTRTLFYRRAALKGILLRPNTKLVEIQPGRVRVADTFSAVAPNDWDKHMLLSGNDEWLEGIDWVVPVIGRRSCEDLYHACKSVTAFNGIEIERVGDCVAPRLIEMTIAEAYVLARAL